MRTSELSDWLDKFGFFVPIAMILQWRTDTVMEVTECVEFWKKPAVPLSIPSVLCAINSDSELIAAWRKFKNQNESEPTKWEEKKPKQKTLF